MSKIKINPNELIRERKEEEIVILSYELYLIEQEEITAKIADKVPLVKDEYEEEIDFFNSYISRK